MTTCSDSLYKTDQAILQNLFIAEMTMTIIMLFVNRKIRLLVSDVISLATQLINYFDLVYFIMGILQKHLVLVSWGYDICMSRKQF